MKTLFAVALTASLFAYGCAPSSQLPQLTEAWVLDGFDSPESVVFSPEKDVLFVSNVNGEGAAIDGNGYISRMSTAGKMIEKEWAAGLDGPKGMALTDERLYVSDINKLVTIDPQSGDVLSTYLAEGAGFLNDVVSTPQGIIVSDSANARLYKLLGEELIVLLEDPRLGGVNGLFMEGETLLITTMSAGELLAMDMSTNELSVMANGMKNADAISTYKRGEYLISSWPGQIHHVGKDGFTSVILDTQELGIYQNDFLVKGRTIYSPNWEPGSVRAYTIE